MPGTPYLILGGLAVVLLPLVTYVRARASLNRGTNWRRAAAAAGLTHVKFKAGQEPSLEGRSGELWVLLESADRERNERGTHVVIGGFAHWPGELSVHKESLASGIEKAMGVKEVVLGDPAFDRVAYVRGLEDTACPLFDAETRKRFGELLRRRPAGSVWLAEERLHCRVSEGLLGLGGEALPAVLPALLDLARHLACPSDQFSARMAHNARHDPLAAVRLKNLQLLLRHRHEPLTLEAATAATHDPDEEVRFCAGAGLAERGIDTLVQIAAESEDLARAARAVAVLGRRLPVERAEELLRSSLRARRYAVALECLDTLGRSGRKEALRPLADVLQHGTDELAAAAAHALGATRDPAAEEPLIAALSAPSEERVVAAARALGWVGTASAVEPLRYVERGPGGPTLHHSARQAIAEIQSRLKGSAGQLSLTSDESGHVSLAEDDARGRLSLDDDRPRGK